MYRLSFISIFLYTSAQAELYADGGYYSSLTPCATSWEYKHADKSLTTLSGCVSITEFPPYTSDSSILLTPSQRTTDQTMWCSTEERYNPFNENNPERRESWGYCHDSALLENVDVDQVIQALPQGNYADGGYQSKFVNCVDSWTYKEKLSDGSNKETAHSGCVSIEDFKPYPYYENNEGEIATLLEPLSSDTSKLKWCPVAREVYNPTPQRDLQNRYNWGFCFTKDAATIPSQEPVTPEPETNSPTESADSYFEYDLPTATVTESPSTSTPKPAPPTSSPSEEQQEDDKKEEEQVVKVSADDKSVVEIVGLEVLVAVGLVCLALVMLVVLVRRKRNQVRSIFGDDEDEEYSDYDDEEEEDLEVNRRRGNRAGLF